jgi:prepilin-type N-terminal cleavage/methylation domain-containing protein
MLLSTQHSALSTRCLGNRQSKIVNRQSAFTLIEMVIVVGIVVTLMTIALPITMRMQQRENVPQAARLLQGMLVGARNRALLDRRPTGVRLYDPNNDGLVTEVEYIQDWVPFQEGYVRSRLPTDTPDFTSDQIETGTGGPTNPTGAPTVNPGVPRGVLLFFKLVKDPLSGNMIEAPTAVDADIGAIPGTHFIELYGGGQLYRLDWRRHGISEARIGLDRPLPHPVRRPVDGQSNYKLFRQPRPIAGESPVKLPEGAAIDLNARTGNPPTLSPPYWHDGAFFTTRGGLSDPEMDGNNSNVVVSLVFSPAGPVTLLTRRNGAFGPPTSDVDIIYYWVRGTRTTEGELDNQALVAVYARTGAVGIFDVNHGNPADPRRFVIEGRGQGM